MSKLLYCYFIKNDGSPIKKNTFQCMKSLPIILLKLLPCGFPLQIVPGVLICQLLPTLYAVTGA